MRIFGSKKKTEIPELTLSQMRTPEKYDFFSALAKALLLFALTYGSLGGFLSAYVLEYNNGACMLLFLSFALFLSAAYETGKRWLENLSIIFYFIAFVYMTRAGYNYILNGYYTILNRVYETARLYLNVDEGTEYSISIDNPYLTVTMFTLFLGMVLILLLNIMLQKKSSLIRTLFLTLPLYAIPFYFDRSPDLIYILLMLTGYVTVAVLQSRTANAKLSRQIRFLLPLMAILTILIVRTGALILPENSYRKIVSKNALKETSEETMVQFARYGLWAVFRRTGTGAGVNGGMLSKDPVIMPNYETVLKVRYTPYDTRPVYLKSFTGKVYLGNRWTRAEDDLPDDGMMLAEVDSRVMTYYGLRDDEPAENGRMQGRGIMEVERMNGADVHEYRPYYTNIISTTRDGNTSRYTYYPLVNPADAFTVDVSDVYLEVPYDCRDAVKSVCEEAGFSGTPEEIASQIANFFQNNYTYTLRPGLYYGDPDYITHFLLESKRGYCSHFASAATMLFRYMGIPARYVEGYAFSFQDVTEGAALVEGAEYDDYYEGYSPLGETALVELEVPGSYAHAWVEIHTDQYGWTVVDPTPAHTAQEDGTSFWDAFTAGRGSDAETETQDSNLGAYLEGALGSMSYVLPAAAALFAGGLLLVYLSRAYRERKLPARERVRLEYRRLASRLGRKNADFKKLPTLKEQLDWIRTKGLWENSAEQENALYQVFFAKSADCGCEELYRQLRRVRRALTFFKRY